MATIPRQDDHVYRFTRLLAVIIIPFLIFAWIILYLLSDRTAALRSWSDFNPANSATWLFIGGLSGLLIGIVILSVGVERKRPGFRPIVTQTEEV